jgi:hypothetical protein
MSDLDDFLDYVAQNGAYNGSDDEGQRFYDWGLNAWLHQMRAAFVQDRTTGVQIAGRIADYPHVYTPTSRSTGDEHYSRWAACKPCSWRGPDRSRWCDAEADFARHVEGATA